MPSLVWAHICEYAAVDASRRPMIIAEFDTIHTKSLPLQFPFFCAAAKWNGHSGEEFYTRVRITTPSRKQLAFTAAEKVVLAQGRKGEGNHVSISAFVALKFEEWGEYPVEFIVNNNPVHVLPLIVVENNS